MADIAELKAEIRALILTLDSRCTEREFRGVYYEFNGKTINELYEKFNLDLESFLSLMPDVCTLRKDDDGQLIIYRVSDEATKHMNHLTIKKKESFRKPVTFRVNNRRPVHNIFRKSRQSRWSPYKPRGESTNTTSRKSSFTRDTVKKATTNKPFVRHPEKVVYNSSGLVLYKGNETITTSQQQQSSIQVTAKKALKIVHPKATTKKPFVPPKQPTQQPLIPKAGSHSKERVVYNQSKIVIYNGDEKIVTNVPSCTDNVSQTSSSTELQSFLPPVLTNGIDHSNDDDDDVIIVDQFPNVVKFSRTPPQPPKIEGIKLMPKNISNLLPATTTTLTKGRLFGKAIENIVHQPATKRNEHQSTALDKILDDFITDDDFQIALPQIVVSPPYFSIKILDISSPSLFTFQFGFEELKELKVKMRLFYENLEGIEDFQARRLKKGIVVAVRHSKKWFRAQVVSLKGDFVEIIPVDCMTLKNRMVHKSSVFYLHNSFVAFSQKSGVASVHGIEPIDAMWSQQSINEFFKLMTANVCAKVVKFENNIYHFTLVDVSSRITFARALIQKKYARTKQQDLAEHYMYASLK